MKTTSAISQYLNARDFGAKGSLFQSAMQAVAGLNVITVEDVGDFEVGDEVIVTKCYTDTIAKVLHERKDTSPVQPRKWVHNQSIGDRVELDGYDGSQGSRIVYFIDFNPDTPGILRWTNSFGDHWTENVAVCENGWTEIERGIRVKVNDFVERTYGATAVFVCEDKTTAFIEKIEGNKIYLSKIANKTAQGEIMHADSFAIQKAIDAALEQNRSVYLPNGRYRLANSLRISDAQSISFVGESSQGTIIDNGFGHVGVESANGSCFIIENCKEVELKNLSMIGNSGFEDQHRMRTFGCQGGDSVYGFYYNKTNATFLGNNESVYIENCHARNMSAECFYACGKARELSENPEAYRRSITYNRCTVENCARNAFNNNDQGELTSILYCRVIDVAGCSWEGASRFVKVHGCYFRNAGTVCFGNVRRRLEDRFSLLGTGQHIITNNYFENNCPYGHSMIEGASTATQIIIQNNTFINFNSNAIRMMGECGNYDTTCENAIISGNCMDMTAIASESVPRQAIRISACFVTLSDNQIFIRGARDENCTAIALTEDITKLSVHDNTISGCGRGIVGEQAIGTVGIIKDDRSFYRKPVRTLEPETFPRLLRRLSDSYRGWHFVWEKDGVTSEVEFYDWQTMEFKLTEPRVFEVGERFRIYNPKALPWSIHHNIIDNCGVGLDIENTLSGARAMLDHNLVSE